MTGATMMSGIEIAKILRFFTILQCVFPSRRTMFYAAQIVMRPLISEFYKLQQHKLLREISERQLPIYLCMDGQYDSPGFAAYNCTVTAIEAVSKKIVAFSTVQRSQVNNKTCNGEPAGFRNVLNFLISKDIQIASVTSDNSSSFNKMIREEYPDIRHHLDLAYFKKYVS